MPGSWLEISTFRQLLSWVSFVAAAFDSSQSFPHLALPRPEREVKWYSFSCSFPEILIYFPQIKVIIRPEGSSSSNQVSPWLCRLRGHPSSTAPPPVFSDSFSEKVIPTQLWLCADLTSKTPLETPHTKQQVETRTGVQPFFPLTQAGSPEQLLPTSGAGTRSGFDPAAIKRHGWFLGTMPWEGLRGRGSRALSRVAGGSRKGDTSDKALASAGCPPAVC